MQLGVIQRELTQERDQRTRLELLEGDLLHKLQVKENELKGLNSQMFDLEDKLKVKTDAIEKAHKVIQAMSDELQEGATLITRLE